MTHFRATSKDTRHQAISVSCDRTDKMQVPSASARMKEPKVVVIREEFIALTRDSLIAIVLNQLVYWSQRVSDFNLFWEEEIFSSHTGTSSPQHGWFYKSANELLEETMVCVTPITMRRYLSFLMEQGWVQTRVNPRYKWDRTIQYRVNFRKLYTDLQALGFGLPGFPPHAILPSFQKGQEEKNDPSNLHNLTLNENEILPSDGNSRSFESIKNAPSKDQKLSFHGNKKFFPSKKPKKSACVKNDPSNLQNLIFDEKESLPSNKTPLHSRMEKNVGCNTEIINREHTQKARARATEQISFFTEVLRIWNTCLSQEGFTPVHLTDERRRKIHVLFPLYFENDLKRWQCFCERVARSPFLMGQGPRKWRVSLDWVLCEENLLKVMEGNFDSAETLSQKTEKVSEVTRSKEIESILNSIEDPHWKTWCSMLNLRSGLENSVSLGELKNIANARFLEIEGDRLVWIGSSEKSVLDCIENLRLKILPVVQKTFPNMRNLRTRLEETISDREEPFSLLKDIRSRDLSKTGLSEIGHSNSTHLQQRSPFNGTHLKGETYA